MAETWRCPACTTTNDFYRFSCATCGLSRPASPGEQPSAQSTLQSVAASPAAPVAPSPPPSAAPPGTTPEPAATSPYGTPFPPAAVGAPVAPDEPAGPRPLWRRIPPGLAIFAVILVIGAATSWYFGAGRSSTGELTKSGDLHASELQVGDCFDLKDATAENVEDVSAKVCGEEHEFEVFRVGTLPEGDFPGDAAFDAFVEDDCLAAFATYIGRDYYESELDIFYFTPSPDAWADGDRTIQCAVYHPLDSRLTGSLKASNR
jgi:hypothetical protein